MSDDLIHQLLGIQEDLPNEDDRNALGFAIHEISRLQDAKRAALKLADERAKEANGLRQQLAKAKLALENIAAWRKVNMVGEFEPGLRDIIRSMTDCAADALDSLIGEVRKCQKCGAPTKGEEAYVDGQYWCHSCADAITNEKAT